LVINEARPQRPRMSDGGGGGGRRFDNHPRHSGGGGRGRGGSGGGRKRFWSAYRPGGSHVRFDDPSRGWWPWAPPGLPNLYAVFFKLYEKVVYPPTI